MTNEDAIERLEEFAELAARAVTAATWAQAFLTEGGEPTWDAVKHVSRVAFSLRQAAVMIERFEDNFDDIAPF